MYFWNYRALANDLRDNKVSKSQFTSYAALFGMLLIYGLLVKFANRYDTAQNFEIVTTLGYAGWVIILGVAYYINHLGDNKDFIKRFICFYLPINVRLLLLGLILSAITAATVYRPCLQLDEQEMMQACIQEKTNDSLIIGMGVLALTYNIYLNVMAFSIASKKEVQ